VSCLAGCTAQLVCLLQTPQQESRILQHGCSAPGQPCLGKGPLQTSLKALRYAVYMLMCTLVSRPVCRSIYRPIDFHIGPFAGMSVGPSVMRVCIPICTSLRGAALTGVLTVGFSAGLSEGLYFSFVCLPCRPIWYWSSGNSGVLSVSPPVGLYVGLFVHDEIATYLTSLAESRFFSVAVSVLLENHYCCCGFFVPPPRGCNRVMWTVSPYSQEPRVAKVVRSSSDHIKPPWK
jgi:hypothetical protein